jgi:serine/threonine-protein kinase
LKNLLKQRGRFTIEETLELMVQACAGVGYAHRAGLVHCDIKPQNMLITDDWRLKVTDFGIARALASINPDEKAAVVWGSPHYFSPEQASGSAPSPASDVYSLGIVMYEMLTGVLPFSASSAAALARLHRETLPTTPRQLNPNIPPELELVLLKVLSKEPSARYRTADQLGRVLTTLRDSLSEKADAVSVFPPEEEKLLADTSVFLESHHLERIPTRIAPSRKRSNPLDIDWVTIGLSLLALIAVGGLIPFFLWVYFVFNPPIR